MKRLTVAGLMLGMMLMAVCAFGAGVPQVINYSGTLTNKVGAPVPDGPVDIEFNIYNVPSAGTSLWTEKWSSTAVPSSPVLVTGGVFNVMLGTIVPFPNGFFADNPNTYLGIKVGADSEMLPRQKIASVGYSFAAGNGVPKGGVIMWSGAVTAIPEGWALCNGANGTPDLRDKFVLGAGGSLPVTGGATTHQHGIADNDLNHFHGVYGHTHNYSGSTSGTSATRKIEDGNDHYVTKDEHTHTFGGATDAGTGHTTNYASEQGFTGLNHSHGGATVPGGTILPPYYALAFIMKQ